MAPHGGGAFSGKDPSKVDRSAAYAARYVAKNIVAAGLASKCEVQVSYAIGVAEPTPSGQHVRHRPHQRRKDREAGPAAFRPAPVRHHPDARPAAPDLPQDRQYGHFGRNEPQFTWEATDKVEALKDAVGLVAVTFCMTHAEVARLTRRLASRWEPACWTAVVVRVIPAREARERDGVIVRTPEHYLGAAWPPAAKNGPSRWPEVVVIGSAFVR